MGFELPASLDRDRHTLAEEVTYARGLTPEQRIFVVARVCRSALWLLQMHPKRDRVLQLRDPLPESTVRALKRLRIRN